MSVVLYLILLLRQNPVLKTGTQMNDFNRKYAALESIYRSYDKIAWSLRTWKCGPGCASCCTSLVILTSLEAAYLWERLDDSVRERLGPSEENAPALALTTNEQASLCLAGADFEEQVQHQPAYRCPLLVERHCACYQARPLMCRVMFSSVQCSRTGHAEIPSVLLSLNTACLQIIEDLDRNGWSGYLVHLLPHFANEEFSHGYRAGQTTLQDERVRRNNPNPGLLIPPEDQAQVEKWLAGLYRHLQILK